MNYWLVKSEPDVFSWDDLVKAGSTTWDGVRNFAARNHLRGMKKNDKVLFYHSHDTEIVGIARVSKEAYPDPSSKEPPDRWSAVDLVPDKPLKNPVHLTAIKNDKVFDNFLLVRVGRLSVMPVKPEEFDRIIELSKGAK